VGFFDFHPTGTMMATAKKKAEEQVEALFDRPTAVQPAEKVTSDYRALLAQHAALEEKIKAAREEEVAGVLEQIRQLVDDYGLHDQVQFTHARAQRGRSGPRGTVAAKYRAPDSGKTWSGRGMPPSWIAGKDRTQFLID